MTPFAQAFTNHFRHIDQREYERYHGQPHHQREFTPDEIDNARACGCPSCRKKYGLPDEPQQASPLATIGAFALLGAVVFGVIKLIEHMDAQETKTDETVM